MIKCAVTTFMIPVNDPCFVIVHHKYYPLLGFGITPHGAQTIFTGPYFCYPLS